MRTNNYFRVQVDFEGAASWNMFLFDGDDERSANEAWMRAVRVRDAQPGGGARIVAWRRPSMPGPWSSGGLFLVGQVVADHEVWPSATMNPRLVPRNGVSSPAVFAPATV